MQGWIAGWITVEDGSFSPVWNSVDMSSLDPSSSLFSCCSVSITWHLARDTPDAPRGDGPNIGCKEFRLPRKESHDVEIAERKVDQTFRERWWGNRTRAQYTQLLELKTNSLKEPYKKTVEQGQPVAWVQRSLAQEDIKQTMHFLSVFVGREEPTNPKFIRGGGGESGTDGWSRGSRLIRFQRLEVEAAFQPTVDFGRWLE